MQKINSIIFLCWLLLTADTVSAQNDSLYDLADVVVSGRIISISGGMMDDLGTEIFQVTIETDSVYKQNLLITSHPMTINWQVSNLRCTKETLKDCIMQYASGQWIFFLNKQHFYGGDELSPQQVVPYTAYSAKVLNHIQEEHLLTIDHYGLNKTCSPDCTLCYSIKTENWKRVKRYLVNQAKGHTNDTLLHHRRIKWISTDRHVLASLPSFCGSRMLFVTQTREVEAYAGYQLGYYKCHATWMPHLLHALFRWQAYRHFCKEKIDTTILRSFHVDSNFSADYFRYEKMNYTRMLTDTLKQPQYGLGMPLPDEYVLLSSVFDGEMNLYLDYQTMPDYMERSKKRIDELAAQRKVYLLSLITTHTIPELAIHSLNALKNLHDTRCIPFLIELAEYTSAQYEKGYKEPLLHEGFMQTLVETLDDLTDCVTIPQSMPYGVSGNAFDLGMNIPVWKKRINIIDYKSRFEEIR